MVSWEFQFVPLSVCALPLHAAACMTPQLQVVTGPFSLVQTKLRPSWYYTLMSCRRKSSSTNDCRKISRCTCICCSYSVSVLFQSISLHIQLYRVCNSNVKSKVVKRQKWILHVFSFIRLCLPWFFKGKMIPILDQPIQFVSPNSTQFRSAGQFVERSLFRFKTPSFSRLLFLLSCL